MNEYFWDKKQDRQPIDWKQDKDTGNWKPVFAKPSAWNGIPGAASAIAQVQAAQMARVSNDNRSSVTNDTDLHGGIHIHTSATDASGISRDAEAAFKKRSFAMAANYGQA